MGINRQRNNISRSQSFSFGAWCVFLPSGYSQLLMCLFLAQASGRDLQHLCLDPAAAALSIQVGLPPLIALHGYQRRHPCHLDLVVAIVWAMFNPIEKFSPWLTSSSCQIEGLSSFLCRLVNHPKTLAKLREIKAIAYLICSMGRCSSVKAYIQCQIIGKSILLRFWYYIRRPNIWKIFI